MLKILLPTDGSTRSLDAVHHALQLVTKGLQAEFVVANVQAPANLYEMVVAHDPKVLQEVSEAAGQDLMHPAIEILRAAGIEPEREVTSGDPAHALLEIIERYECDAVILSARGSGDQDDPSPGLVAQELVETCPVPITVVKSVPVTGTEPGED